MKKILMLALLLPSAAMAASGLEIRGIAVGDVLAKVMSTHPEATCRAAEGEFAEQTCTARGYGSASDAIVMYWINGGVVTEASVMFDHSSYRAVVASMKLKLGEPDIAKSETLTNAMGASFSSERLVWVDTSKKQFIEVEERAGRIDRTIVKLYDAAARRATLERVRARRASDADNL